RNVYIIDAVRTPIGISGGVHSKRDHRELFAHVLRGIHRRNARFADEIVCANIIGTGGNVARYSSLLAGWPEQCVATTIDKQCGAGLEAIRYGYALIASGCAESVVAGGTESATHTPFLKRASFTPPQWGDPDMITAANELSKKRNISRETQDLWGMKSYERYFQSLEKGTFLEEILVYPDCFEDEVRISERNYQRLIARAAAVEGIDSTVTAGNASGWNDGASAVLLCAKLEPEIEFALRIVDVCSYGGEPSLPGAGAAGAIQKLLQKQNIAVEDIDVWEVNEAFAVVVCDVIACFNLQEERVNQGGGAIAFGHPFGASGAILVTRLFHTMKEKKLKRGIASIAIAGGQGVSILVEAIRDANG
ncbi:MAG: thiolase family protein, partial [Bacilli bacterium]